MSEALTSIPGAMSNNTIASRFRQASILVADSNRATRQTLRDILVGMGFTTVLQAADAPTAFDMIVQEAPMIVLLDVSLSKVDGINLTRRLRRDPMVRNPRLPIILMVQQPDIETVRAARDGGVDEIVVKPINIAALIRRLVYLLNSRRRFFRLAGYIGPDRRRRNDRRQNERRHGTVPSLPSLERRSRKDRRAGGRRTQQATPDTDEE